MSRRSGRQNECHRILLKRPQDSDSLLRFGRRIFSGLVARWLEVAKDDFDLGKWRLCRLSCSRASQTWSRPVGPWHRTYRTSHLNSKHSI